MCNTLNYKYWGLVPDFILTWNRHLTIAKRAPVRKTCMVLSVWPRHVRASVQTPCSLKGSQELSIQTPCWKDPSSSPFRLHVEMLPVALRLLSMSFEKVPVWPSMGKCLCSRACGSMHPFCSTALLQLKHLELVSVFCVYEKVCCAFECMVNVSWCMAPSVCLIGLSPAREEASCCPLDWWLCLDASGAPLPPPTETWFKYKHTHHWCLYPNNLWCIAF